MARSAIFIHDFLVFGYKQAYASIFGGFLIFMIMVTHFSYPFEGLLPRYDFLFFGAILFQIFLIAKKWELWEEVWIIALFHVIAMMMEIFKTHPSIGSWSYPGDFFFGIMYVPLFAGFMYSAVGSYLARVWRILDFRFTRYPRTIFTIPIAVLIYVNFFTHHFIMDLRYVIIFIILLTFGRTQIYFRPVENYYHMNLVLGFSLVAFVIWLAENIATYMQIWVYPSQVLVWTPVGVEKITAWFLLIIISFVLISLIHKPKTYKVGSTSATFLS